MVRLMAHAAQIRGAASYDPPSATMVEELNEEIVRRDVSREAQVSMFVAQTREG